MLALTGSIQHAADHTFGKRSGCKTVSYPSSSVCIEPSHCSLAAPFCTISLKTRVRAGDAAVLAITAQSVVAWAACLQLLLLDILPSGACQAFSFVGRAYQCLEGAGGKGGRV